MRPYMPMLGYTYPKKQDEHMLVVKKKYEVDLSGGYIYRNDTAWYKFKRFWVRALLHLIVCPVTRIRYALKIEGKIDRDIIKNGVMTVCNHTVYWEPFIFRCALPFRNCEFPIWRTNMESALAPMYKLSGALPVPDKCDGIDAIRGFKRAMNEVLEEGKWLHFFPEGSLWYFYAPIREFKQTAFTLAAAHDVPVIPMTVTFREPKGIYKLFKKEPCLTLKVGEAEYADKLMDVRASAKELMEKCRRSMIKMAGFEDEAENADMMNMYSYGK